MTKLEEYKLEMGKLEPDSTQKEALAAHLLTISEPVRRRPRRLGRTAFVAAALSVLLVIGAGAAGLFKTASEAFAGIFGDSPAVVEIVDKIGRPIDVRASDGGLTISADAIIGETNNVCVVFSVLREDGTPFQFTPAADGTVPLTFRTMDLDVPYENGVMGNFRFAQAEPGSDRLQFMVGSSVFGPDSTLKKGMVTARFQDLCTYDPEVPNSPLSTLVKGTWELKFPLQFEDCSVLLDSGSRLTLHDGLVAEVQAITISPLGVKVECLTDVYAEGSYPELIPQITMKDGSVLTPDSYVVGSSNRDSLLPRYSLHSTVNFDVLLDLEQVESVTVADAVFLVP